MATAVSQLLCSPVLVMLSCYSNFAPDVLKQANASTTFKVQLGSGGFGSNQHTRQSDVTLE